MSENAILLLERALQGKQDSMYRAMADLQELQSQVKELENAIAAYETLIIDLVGGIKILKGE